MEIKPVESPAVANILELVKKSLHWVIPVE
jgi:hypothetical protein